MKGFFENIEPKVSKNGKPFWIVSLKTHDGQTFKGSAWDDPSSLIGQDVDFKINTKEFNGKMFTNVYFDALKSAPKAPPVYQVTASDVMKAVNTLGERMNFIEDTIKKIYVKMTDPKPAVKSSMPPGAPTPQPFDDELLDPDCPF